MTDSVDVKVYEERDDGEWTIEARVNNWSGELEVVWGRAIAPGGAVYVKALDLDWFNDEDQALLDRATEDAWEAFAEKRAMAAEGPEWDDPGMPGEYRLGGDDG
jgi:hypothetical protein